MDGKAPGRLGGGGAGGPQLRGAGGAGGGGAEGREGVCAPQLQSAMTPARRTRAAGGGTWVAVWRCVVVCAALGLVAGMVCAALAALAGEEDAAVCVDIVRSGM